MKYDSNEPKPPFTPAQLRPRHDGWTVERQIAFIEALAESGCVEDHRAEPVTNGRAR